MSAPALYWYFSSKEDLYVEVIETSMHDFLQFSRSSITAERASDRLAQFVRAHVTWQLEQAVAARNFDLGRIQARDISSARFEPTRQLQIEYRDNLRYLLQRGQACGVFDIANINVTAAVIITMCEYVFTWFNPQGALTVIEVADHLVGLARNIVGIESR